MPNKINICDLDYLQDVLDRINNDEDINISDLNFSDFSTVKIKIYGTGYDGKLNSNVIHSMSNYHNELLKLYCMVRYRDSNLRNLTSEDKKLLVIEYEVNHGCTEILNFLKKPFESLAEVFEKMTNGMSPKQKTTCYIITVLSVVGYFSFYQAIDYFSKKQDQQNEIDKIKTIQNGILESISSNKQAEDLIENIKNQSQQTYINTVKPLTDVSNIELSNKSLKLKMDKSEISSFVTTNKEKLVTEEGTKELLIESIKRTPERLNVVCSEIGSDYNFNLSVDISFIEPEEIELLFDLFKTNRPVKIKGEFKIRSGIIEKGIASNIYQ